MTDPYVWQYGKYLVLTFCYIFQAKSVVIYTAGKTRRWIKMIGKTIPIVTGVSFIAIDKQLIVKLALYCLSKQIFLQEKVWFLTYELCLYRLS